MTDLTSNLPSWRPGATCDSLVAFLDAVHDVPWSTGRLLRQRRHAVVRAPDVCAVRLLRRRARAGRRRDPRSRRARSSGAAVRDRAAILRPPPRPRAPSSPPGTPPRGPPPGPRVRPAPPPNPHPPNPTGPTHPRGPRACVPGLPNLRGPRWARIPQRHHHPPPTPEPRPPPPQDHLQTPTASPPLSPPPAFRKGPTTPPPPPPPPSPTPATTSAARRPGDRPPLACSRPHTHPSHYRSQRRVSRPRRSRTPRGPDQHGGRLASSRRSALQAGSALGRLLQRSHLGPLPNI